MELLCPPMQGSPCQIIHRFRSIHDEVPWQVTWVRTRGSSGLSGRSLGSFGGRWGDALQREDSEAPIASSWRSKFIEIWLFLWS